MKIPLSSLREYVDVEIDPRELGRRMTLAGVECESVTFTGQAWENVFVGLVEAVTPHPNADRLRLATVSTGGERETVVCGAPNVAPGQKIAFARVGAKLIDGHTGQPTTLKPARIRGVESRGMVCSERELGLSDEHEGILVLPAAAPVGVPFAQYHGDAILDFAPTSNRPDCLSVLGIAREAAALLGQRVREPSLDYPEGGEPASARTRVDILDPDLCPRYIAGIVTGVAIGPSPRWMQARLEASGMRPINKIVDITNYVMLEFGQPLHAFDYDLLAEHRIVVRRAREGEQMAFLDGQTRKLTPQMLAICDAQGPVALAGIMGGTRSEVSERTRSILLESACFSSVVIRRTSQELALRTEASARFEKGLSSELPLHAARRAMQLMVQLAGGTACKGFADAYPGGAARETIRLTIERTKKVLGVEVTTGEMARVLASLGLQAAEEGPGALSVTVPYWRTDVAIEDDLVEEIARIKGYDWVPTTTLSGNIPAYEPQPMLALKDTVRDALVAAGVSEAITYPLTSRAKQQGLLKGIEPLRVANPLSSEQEELRLTLRDSLLRALAANQRNQEGGIRLFEVGRVYLPRKDDLPEEREMLAAALSGPRQEPFWKAAPGDLDFSDAKGLLETLLRTLGVSGTFAPAQDPMLHPGRTAEVAVGGARVGILGELHPRSLRAFDLLPRPAAYLEVDLHRLLPLLPERPHMYQTLPRFPGVIRDIALVLDRSIPAQRVAEIIQATPLVARATLFDIYVGDQVPPGRKSLAFHIVYQAPDRTLTSEEAQEAQDRLLERLRRELGATLRA